jgi:hypothetical protein
VPCLARCAAGARFDTPFDEGLQTSQP